MTVAILLLACLVLAGTVVALGVALSRVRSALASELAALRTEVTEARTSRTEADVAPTVVATDEYVITRLGAEAEEDPAPAMETRLFADLVLRESVVKAASFAYGLGRGLSPANRNRIWFEMRREVKRARKERKAEERQAIREWRARQRADVRGVDAA
jgi:hypothetical protein